MSRHAGRASCRALPGWRAASASPALAACASEELADLVARTKLELGRRLELDAERLLDLAARRPRPCRRRVRRRRLRRDDRRPARAPKARRLAAREVSHRSASSESERLSSHSTSTPAISPTTRAMSWPRMTIALFHQLVRELRLERRERRGTTDGLAAPFASRAPGPVASRRADEQRLELGAEALERVAPLRCGAASVSRRFSASLSVRATCLSSGDPLLDQLLRCAASISR